MTFGYSRGALAGAAFRWALLAVLLLSAMPALAGSVRLAWDPVVSPALVGYTVHHGPSPGNYTVSTDVGNTTSWTVPNLSEGARYYFAVTAYDASRTQSPSSNEVEATVAYATPVADFSASTTFGAAPLAMNFVNASTGTITTYAWTFGDGGTSNAPNPAYVYAKPGVYTVGLTVTGPAGSHTRTRSSYMTVTEGSSTSSPDTSPPAAPATLTATASGSGTINLAWSASSDNVGVTGYRVERCQGSACTNFVQVATVTGTSFSNSGLAAAATYRYRVRAGDAAGNLSGYSPVATATTGPAADTIAPTTPSTLTATASGSGMINLAWSASSDNVGVTGYRLERCQGAGCTNFVQIATVAGTSFSNSGLAAVTTYRYRVRAGDASGNLSGYSPVATATTGLAADTSPPTAPANLTGGVGMGIGGIGVYLAWSASWDNVGVTGYRIERSEGLSGSFMQVGTSSVTHFWDAGVTSGLTYRYRVRAVDAAGNVSAYSNQISVTTISSSSSALITP